MAQKDLQVILTRQLASYLAMPVFIVDPDGSLVFYNEPAERILGQRFDETGEMSADEWSRAFNPTDAEGASLPADDLPLLVALRERRPVHRCFTIRPVDGAVREIATTAFPLMALGTLVGAVAVFWEVARS